MEEDIKLIFDETKDGMGKTIRHLENELLKIRAGKASPVMLDGVKVDYYGTPTPLNQVGAVSAADARTLTIKPWEKSMLQLIERAIIEANLGFNPQNDGEIIRIPIPRLTEERRKQLSKQARAEGENAKIGIRNVRQEANSMLKDLQKEGASEDAIKSAERQIQEITDAHVKTVDETLKKKEEEIMTV
ncbi:MAG: ribosome recycling factor [Bacteroidota bacterium]